LATPVIMPKTGMTQESGTVVRWFYQEGERVEKGEPLLEVMTDKVNLEVEAPASGVLKNVKAFPNDVVPVTQVIAYIAASQEEIVEEGEPVEAAELPPERAAPAQAPATAARESGAVRRVSGRVVATPVARRLAKDRGVDLAGIAGTGPGGAITRADVLQAAEGVSGPQEGKTIPLVGRRRIVAERMQQSARQAPHIALTVEVDMSEAEAARRGASYTALLVYIVARALRTHRLMNSTLRHDKIMLLDDINIGVAVAAEEGLIVPVVKKADVKSLELIDAEFKDLTQRARAGKLTLEDVSGGTFTITNLGMFGISEFRAIINPPEAAILAVGSIIKRPVVIDDGIHIRPMMSITASADHRVLDGVAVANFLQEVKAALERPG
jgi:pyruvate dehydrogenase E2 component (dihydrolipoamide acetyltransferase)